MRVVTMRSSEDEPVYLIGDVHGMAQLLEVLIEAIRLDAAANSANPRIIFLGDIVDRGENSKGAMDVVIDVLESCLGSVLILGNHDEVLVEAVRRRLDDKKFDHWINRQGGDKTAMSYLGKIPSDSAQFASFMLSRFERHVLILEAAAEMVLLDHYCAVHAGIDPARKLSEQTGHDVRWIREPFLWCRDPFERIIVHGHTVTEENVGPEVYKNRVAIDSGAVLGGPLSAMIVAGERPIRFLLASEGDNPSSVRHFSEDNLRMDRDF